jgi:hypothetical protein
MTQELKNALEVIKRHCDTPKGKSFDEYMSTSSLKQQIATLRGRFVSYIDHQTICYYYTQLDKKYPEAEYFDHPTREKVELTEKQRKDCIQELKWFLNDVEACISHLQKK